MPINEIEKKLADYRAKKQREALFEKAKSALWGPKNPAMAEPTSVLVEAKKEEEFDEVEVEVAAKAWTTLDYIKNFLYFILWATIYAIFIKLEFGTIFLIISMFFGIYLGTGTRQKKKTNRERSAYSVFNENCERIPGSLDAEKITQQLMFL